MKKRYLAVGLVAAAAVIMTACAGGKKNETETTKAAIETTIAEPTTEQTSKSEDNIEKENISTIGIYKSSETANDVNGPYTQATFTDEHGNDFIANIAQETIVPEVLEEGETYIVNHSNVMTMSLPGIYPQVYSIEKAERNTNLSETENSEYETGYAEAEDYVEESE